MTDVSAGALEELRRGLRAHPLYSSLSGVRELRIFMEHHVVCVLDFMSLLKRLQAGLTQTRAPWTPPEHPRLARFVNEIVLDEESDAAAGAEPLSHYEWYVGAMDELGADTAPIRRFEARLRRGVTPSSGASGCGLPTAAEEFTRTTFELCSGSLLDVAAAFFHGREEVIPELFVPLVRGLRARGVPCERLLSYLERHVEIDGGQHGELARELLETLAGGRADQRTRARAVGMRALASRRALWDASHAACKERAGRHAAAGENGFLEGVPASARLDAAGSSE